MQKGGVLHRERLISAGVVVGLLCHFLPTPLRADPISKIIGSWTGTQTVLGLQTLSFTAEVTRFEGAGFRYVVFYSSGESQEFQHSASGAATGVFRRAGQVSATSTGVWSVAGDSISVNYQDTVSVYANDVFDYFTNRVRTATVPITNSTMLQFTGTSTPGGPFTVTATKVASAPTTNVVLTVEKAGRLTNAWEAIPITSIMNTPSGELNIGALTNTNEFYRLKIRTVIE